MADTNSTLGDNKVGGFLAETELFDLIGQEYGIGHVNSHINGTKQIDFILGTSKVVEAFQSREIFPFHNIIILDHRGETQVSDSHIWDLEELDDKITRVMAEPKDRLLDFPM
eukprot:5491636-Ditylum_brightwellii.AAC.1